MEGADPGILMWDTHKNSLRIRNIHDFHFTEAVPGTVFHQLNFFVILSLQEENQPTIITLHTCINQSSLLIKNHILQLNFSEFPVGVFFKKFCAFLKVTTRFVNVRCHFEASV